jgi:hypothetical protein
MVTMTFQRRAAGLAACYERGMPVARSQADILCLAVYTLTGGRLMQGRMVMSVARRLGITFDQAVELAEAAAKAGLIRFEHGSSVSLTEKGQERGTKLKPPADDRPGRPAARARKK